MPWLATLTRVASDPNVAEMHAEFTDDAEFVTVPYVWDQRITPAKTADIVVMRTAMRAGLAAERASRRLVATKTEALNAYLNEV